MRDNLREHRQNFIVLAICIIAGLLGLTFWFKDGANHSTKTANNSSHITTYAKAEKRGLIKGHSMTLPNKNGNYYVYIDPASDSYFKDSANVAIDDLNTIMTGTTVFIPTKDKQKANIILMEKEGLLGKDKGKNTVTLGETLLDDASLMHQTKITISRKASDECDTDMDRTIDHELGHALGLEHNHKYHDIMNPVISNKSHFTKENIREINRNINAVTGLK